mmetsp:Transcript_20845/g.23962  ORF Transcript_20845/g.23962 Transcript_20845/m.23962 type:complete len:136 (-) Transcript_20845:213-620(-)|eukprot:CAMPEP_0194367168 /NCGR_PEP_ID=MMETSP0174-20130528/15230_1 /TAXON_ID=216777 /ORGANISM="Proboscia alata, Strain PI-D3" /LENGTH=135 /DNA_ID=CAMNT_0039142753 /DNA_START=67 /DNA_END=474 /DNA_ORIENTATION=-
MSTKSAVVCSYRAIAKLIRGIPESQQSKAIETLRSEFRKNAVAQKSEIPALLKEAEKKASFLRMTTPKSRNRDGPQKASTTIRHCNDDSNTGISAKNRVVSNWSGNNLDPCSVSQHKHQLKRMGFLNNAHAKGIF